jgi:hypothetical protein
MEQLPISDARWLHRQLKPWPPKDFMREGTAIHHVLPSSYESYGRLFHPFEINIAETDALEPNPDFGRPVSITFTRTSGSDITVTEQKEDGTVIDLYEETKRREEERRSQKLADTSWRCVAEKYGLTFHAGISIDSYTARFQKIGWPRNLLFPSEGCLPRKQLINLLAILKQHTVNDEVYIYQMHPHNLCNVDLVRCRFDEVTQYFEADYVGYLYAGDRSWVVFTDNDLHCTVIGGSGTLIEALKDSSLEVLECSSASRIDNLSDDINEGLPRTPSGRSTGAALPTPGRHSIFNRIRKWLARR